MPERVGFKVLHISTKSRLLLRERPETVGEEQEPPCIYAGEASADMSGWEAVAQVRQMDEFTDTPIMAVTAHVSSEEIERAKGVSWTVHHSPARWAGSVGERASMPPAGRKNTCSWRS